MKRRDFMGKVAGIGAAVASGTSPGEEWLSRRFVTHSEIPENLELVPGMTLPEPAEPPAEREIYEKLEYVRRKAFCADVLFSANRETRGNFEDYWGIFHTCFICGEYDFAEKLTYNDHCHAMVCEDCDGNPLEVATEIVKAYLAEGDDG